ncbi:hypothetical protein D6853_02205 [Butyrivibrio sp. X503]|uniref:hypothetical protein n=1 Tax=Butyrivibrio sp. X503 TaxID=2364878 RepID=UPI000EA9284A|nr:hypothetical protein [Butyrivibrio sp. X503]RKM58367.1 hypothetical protein D6853_02205 [Butyrivibrio sp. X503]
MKKKKIALVLMLMAMIFILCACTANAPVHSKREVKKYIDQLCNEEHEIVSIEEVSESPRAVVYTVRSKERDLEFEVVTCRSAVFFPTSSTVLYYEKSISDDYVKKIHEIYKDDINQLFKGYEIEYTGAIPIRDINEIESVAESIHTANMIYSDEMKYNSREFLDAHPYCYIYLSGINKEDGNTSQFIQFKINGSDKSTEEITEEIKDAIAQKITDGVFSKETYTGLDEITSKQHKSKLNHVFLNDEEMLYDNNNSPYVYAGLITDEYCYSAYNYDIEKYMMVVDCGLVADYWGSPALVIPEYVDHLGGQYTLISTDQKERKLNLESEWEINGHKWKMTAYYNGESEDYDKSISKVKVIRDGKNLSFTAYAGPDNRPLIMLTADDFCKLFDLTYKVDEEKESIYFYSN